jgi:hypothetical protein
MFTDDRETTHEMAVEIFPLTSMMDENTKKYPLIKIYFIKSFSIEQNRSRHERQTQIFRTRQHRLNSDAQNAPV